MEIVAKLKEGNHHQHLYVRNDEKVNSLVATIRGIPEVKENEDSGFHITVLSNKEVQEILGFFHADKVEWE